MSSKKQPIWNIGDKYKDQYKCIWKVVNTDKNGNIGYVKIIHPFANFGKHGDPGSAKIKDMPSGWGKYEN